MRIHARFSIVIALILLSLVSLSALAKEKGVGVWKPTNMVGADAPQGVAVSPDGSIWALYGPPDGSAPWSLVRSDDGGTTWTTVLAHSVEIWPYISFNVDLWVVDSASCAWVYTLSEGLSRFSPSGDLLTTTGLDLSSSFFGSQMVSSLDGYLYRLTNGLMGDTLERISWNGQVRTTPFPPGEIAREMAVDSKGTLFTVGYAVRRSRDGGLNWEILLEGRLDFPFFYISIAPDDTIYITSPSFKRSTDGGETWETVESGASWIVGLPDGSITAIFGVGATIPGGVFRYFLYRSWDRGNTWTYFLPGIDATDFRAGSVVGAYGDRTVYAYFSFLEGAASPDGLYRLLLPSPSGRAGADKAWLKY